MSVGKRRGPNSAHQSPELNIGVGPHFCTNGNDITSHIGHKESQVLRNVQQSNCDVISSVQLCETSNVTDSTCSNEHVPDEFRPTTHVNDVPCDNIPSPASENPRVAQVHTVASPFLGNYVSLQVRTLKLFALVDSGAEISCIHPDLLENRELQKFKIHVSDRDYIETATGDRTAIQGMICVRA